MKISVRPPAGPRKWVLVVVITSLCAAAISAAGAGAWLSRAGAVGVVQGGRMSPAFTMTSTLTHAPADAPPRLVATHVRRHRQDGLFAIVSTYHGAGGAGDRVVTTFGAAGVGVFGLDEGRGRLVFRGPLPDAPQGDVAGALRADPRFDREESVAGVVAVVLRERDEEGGGFRETFHAPALAGLVVKSVRESGSGREVFETTSFQAGEPDQAPFDGWRHPADYDQYMQKVRREGERGRTHEAERLARELEKVKKIKP